MKYIYLYTTETYRLKNWYKIGESIADPKLRIKQQDNASNPEPLITIKVWEVSDNLTDKKVHSRLEACGFPRLRFNREWFELSANPADDIESCFLDGDKILTPSLITGPDFVYKRQNTKKPSIIIDIPHYTDLWWHKSI